jgi:hypothetical protein
MKNGYAFAGTNAHLATKIISVKETFENLKNEFKAALEEKYLKFKSEK